MLFIAVLGSAAALSLHSTAGVTNSLLHEDAGSRSCEFLDWGTTEALGRAKHAKCNAGKSRAWLVESSAAPAQCKRRPSAFLEYERVHLRDGADGLALVLDCEKNPAFETPAGGGVAGALPEVFASGGDCAKPVEEETILVRSPRMEYLQNFYHAVEEVFSLGQTKKALGENLGRSTRLVFVWPGSTSGSSKFYQPGTDAPGERVATAIPQIVELFAQIMTPERTLSALKLPEVTGGDNRGLCFRRLILPMRACTGSVVPASWAEHSCTAPADNPFVSLPRLVRGAFHIPATAAQPRASALVVLWIHRAASEAGGRYVRNDDDLVRDIDRDLAEGSAAAPEPWVLIQDTRNQGGADLERRADLALVAKLRNGLQNAHVRPVDFKKYSMAQQLQTVADVDVLAGRHGAGLAHLLFSKPTTRVVELTSHPPPVPGRSVANIFYNLAKWSFREYASVYVDGGASLSTAQMDRAAETVRTLALHLREPSESSPFSGPPERAFGPAPRLAIDEHRTLDALENTLGHLRRTLGAVVHHRKRRRHPLDAAVTSP